MIPSPAIAIAIVLALAFAAGICVGCTLRDDIDHYITEH